MKNVLVLAQKETKSFFYSWMGVAVVVFFLLLAGIFFSLLVLTYSKISMDSAREAYREMEGLGLTRFVFGSYFLNVSVVLIFLVPVLTMRAFAEERRLHTLEILFTYPFSDFEIVFGKFFGLLGTFFAISVPTIAYVVLLEWLGGHLDWGPVLLGFFGFWLLGSAYLSLGLFFSTLTESQIAASVATFASLVIFWMLDWIADITDGFWAQFFKTLSPLDHYRKFTLGILDLSDVVYFVFFIFYFLFLILRSVETRNWKG